MADDPTKKKIDRHSISTVQPWERAYWTKQLGVGVDDIRGAMRATGSHGVKAIKEYLKKKK